MATQSLLTEVDVLRKVEGMEGKDEDLIQMVERCRDLDRRLAKETSYCRSLKFELDKLNGRLCEMEKMEEALGKSKQDCSILRSTLERERDFSKMVSGELETLRLRVEELEAAEKQLEQSEVAVRHDLGKLRSLTVALVDNRKNMAERLRQAEEKFIKKEGKRSEQDNLATVTHRLREERQLALRSKADLEEKIKRIIKEKDELQDKLKTEEEQNRELQSKIVIMKKKLNILDNEKEKEEEYLKSSIQNASNFTCQTGDNKVKELTRELQELRQRLKDKEVLDVELQKIQEDFELLEKKLKDEETRTQALMQELDGAKRELSQYKHGEKQEVNKEHILLCHLQKEQVKSRLLTREVDALKEKLHKLQGTEESICKVQFDQSTLQQSLTQHKAKNKELAQEIEKLTRELNGYKQARNWSEGANEDFPDHQMNNREVQTEPERRLLPTSSKCNEKSMEGNVDKSPSYKAEVTSDISSFSGSNYLNKYNSQSDVDLPHKVKGEVMMLTHTPGQPLQIKVTPHHTLNTATLEITSPSGDSAASYTSMAAVAGGRASPKQRITIIQNSGSPVPHKKHTASSPDGSTSPINAKPESLLSSPKLSRCSTPNSPNSPVQIVTVKTCSPEPADTTNQFLICKTPPRPGGNETNSSIVAAEESKIHIHLGSPFIHPLNGTSPSTPQPTGPYYLRHEQRTQVIANGYHVKGVGKITSSITISPANANASLSDITDITVSGLCD